MNFIVRGSMGMQENLVSIQALILETVFKTMGLLAQDFFKA